MLRNLKITTRLLVIVALWVTLAVLAIGQLADSFNMMTDKLMVSRDELINAKNHTEKIIRTMDNILLVVSPDAKIKTVNQSALNLQGYKEDELIGKSVNQIFVEKGLFKRTKIQDLIRNGFIKGVEKTYITKNGREIPVLFSSSVIRDDRGELQKIVYVATDITDRKQIEVELKDSAEADRKKTERLERFHKLTIDWRYDVIRLKQEVNALLEELGQPNKYKAAAKIRLTDDRCWLLETSDGDKGIKDSKSEINSNTRPHELQVLKTEIQYNFS